ncbi:unnamed protein product [Phaeothamnion confervicola]
MGASASVATDTTLTEADKAELFTHLKAKYDETLSRYGGDAPLNEADMLANLKVEYETKARELVKHDTATAAATSGSGGGGIAPAAPGGTEANSEQDEPLDASPDSPGGGVVLLEGAVSDDEAAATALAFAAKLGDIGSSGGSGTALANSHGNGAKPSDFRKRRLSVSAKKAAARGVPDGEVRRSSKVMYRSLEIGAVPAVPLPFPDTVVGTYSCHGVEPSYYEEDGVAAKINQDRGCVVYPFAEDPHQVLFSVLDGHGEHGDVVSHFAMHELQQTLEQHAALAADPAAALMASYLAVDKALGKAQTSESTFSGTTCVTVLLRGTQLWIANAGDSRAVMAVRCNGAAAAADNGSTLEAVDLSHDQNPDSPAEYARIINSGGFVSPPPEPGLSARVWLDREMTQIGLAMARSLGDHAVKPIGVIAEPEVTTRQLTAADEFMVLASDGVWEFLSSQEVVDIVSGKLRGGATAMQATQALIEAAAQRWREAEGTFWIGRRFVQVVVRLFLELSPFLWLFLYLA